jgi:hypothetical protein
MTDFSSFKSSFKGDIISQEHPDYAAAIARWSATAERKAKYVAFVKDTDDIAAAIKFRGTRNSRLRSGVEDTTLQGHPLPKEASLLISLSTSRMSMLNQKRNLSKLEQELFGQMLTKLVSNTVSL